MMVCNPMNLAYKYQFHGRFYGHAVCREAADPSVVQFKSRYYLFASMSVGFWVSDDMAQWEYHAAEGLPAHDYAPDVCVMGDYLYFSASRRNSKCLFFRTKDPLAGEFEEVAATMTFWDPHLFGDDDGRVYFYWGCSNKTPLYGVELDPHTMMPLGKPIGLVHSDVQNHGFERNGENHRMQPPETFGEKVMRKLAGGTAPYIEGAWMTKHNGQYYLQYAATGAEYNVYADGVYVGQSPLGPFTYAQNNPYSYRPGGFMPGAGHGSTVEDKHGNLWHAATMRISVNHTFERRVGLFPAGFDKDGELFCNQRYGDWPMRIEQAPFDPWRPPTWMLLSYAKPATASSSAKGKTPDKAADECERTWWRAASPRQGEWLQLDLGSEMRVHGIQLNFADDGLEEKPPNGAKWGGEWPIKRYIDTRKHHTRWLLEASLDGRDYFPLCDKRKAETDLPNDFVSWQEGVATRYIRCTVFERPYGQPAALLGLRVFGLGGGAKPERVAKPQAKRTGATDMEVCWQADKTAVGHAVLWGHKPDKLYHSCMVYGKTSCHIGALNVGQPCFARVDAFNEAGITEGDVVEVLSAQVVQ